MDIRVSKTVRCITVLSPQGGRWQPTTIYKKKGRKNRKSSKILRPLERSVRCQVQNKRAFADTYLKRHNKSARKKRDGWIRDLEYNIYRARCKKARTVKSPFRITSIFRRYARCKRARTVKRPFRMISLLGRYARCKRARTVKSPFRIISLLRRYA